MTKAQAYAIETMAKEAGFERADQVAYEKVAYQIAGNNIFWYGGSKRVLRKAKLLANEMKTVDVDAHVYHLPM